MSLFNNLKVAFSDKSNKDLNRAYFLFSIIRNPIISKILINLTRIFIFLKLPITPLIKMTIYKHFCGGTSINNSKSVIDKLWESKIGSILDFSAEGKEQEKDYIIVMKQTIEAIEKAKQSDSIPFAVFKPTGLIKFNILKKLHSKEVINKQEKKEYNLFIKRVEKICRKAKEFKVPVLVDAEESWIQDPIDEILLNMMRKYNLKNAWVFNTLQMYRIDRLDYLNKIINIAKEESFILGIKLVRGAYHEKEIIRAIKKKYIIPVFENKDNTDNNYNEALKICCNNINLINLCAGTHNEISNEILIKYIEQSNIMKNDKRIYLSQLYGMSDNISYNAAINGFNVTKYVPYGPVKDVIPYLLRRAEENTSISGQMGRELANIIKEKSRRKGEAN